MPRFLSSTTQEDRFRKVSKTADSGERTWNVSEQNARYEAEQLHRLQSRAIKRTSEICPHRLDHMYFLTGASMRPQDKYSVDEQEVARLRQMADARKQTKHYGRGLSSQRRDTFITDLEEKELPQQPPPSSLSHVEYVSPEEAAIFQNSHPLEDEDVKVIARSETGRSLDEDSVSMHEEEDDAILDKAREKSGNEDNLIAAPPGEQNQHEHEKPPCDSESKPVNTDYSSDRPASLETEYKEKLSSPLSED